MLDELESCLDYVSKCHVIESQVSVNLLNVKSSLSPLLSAARFRETLDW